MPQAIGLAIGAFLFNAGAPLALVNFFALTFPTIITSVGAIAVSSLVGRLARPTPPKIKPGAAQQEVREPLAFRREVVGVRRVSGIVFWYDRAPSATTELFYGWALCEGPIGSFIDFRIDDNLVTLDGTDLVTGPDPYTGAGIYLHSRTGLPTETAYSDLETYFGVAEARGDGVASILGRFHRQSDPTDQSTVYPGGLPAVVATIDGRKIFDPRDSAQSYDDPDTWDVTENPVVAALYLLTSRDGFAADYTTEVLPNLAEWTAAMNICDEDLALRDGGTGTRYRVSAMWDFGERPADVMARILSACDGRVTRRRDGTFGVSVGRFTAPSVTLTDAEIAGYHVIRGQDRLTGVAGLRANYLEPANDYKEQEAEPWPSGAIVNALGDEKVDTLDLTFCPAHHQARRLLKREFLKRTSGWQLSITTNLAGLRAIDERFVHVTLAEFGLDADFEVQKWSIDFTALACSLDLVAIGAEIDAWDAASEEGDPSLVEDFDVEPTAFSKDGTAIDPIAEGNGAAGLAAVVFVATTDAAGIAATPSGWNLIASAGPSSGIAFAAFLRVLDGSEGSTTFLGGAGVLTQVNLKNAGSDFSWTAWDQISTGIPTPQIVDAIAAPVALFAFGACTAADTGTWLELGDAYHIGTDLADFTTIHAAAGGPTLAVRLAIYRDYETAPTRAYGKFLADKGTNALMAIALSPQL